MDKPGLFPWAGAQAFYSVINCRAWAQPVCSVEKITSLSSSFLLSTNNFEPEHKPLGNSKNVQPKHKFLLKTNHNSEPLFFHKLTSRKYLSHPGFSWSGLLMNVINYLTLAKVPYLHHSITRHCKHLQQSQSHSVELIFAPWLEKNSGLTLVPNRR